MTYAELADLIGRMSETQKMDDVTLVLHHRAECYPLAAMKTEHAQQDSDDFQQTFVLVPWCPDLMQLIDLDQDHGDLYAISFDTTQDDGPEEDDDEGEEDEEGEEGEPHP